MPTAVFTPMVTAAADASSLFFFRLFAALGAFLAAADGPAAAPASCLILGSDPPAADAADAAAAAVPGINDVPFAAVFPD